MALTRITKGVIKPNEDYSTRHIISTGIVTTTGLDVNGNADISGNFSVGGVLTYEDVTSIDSVGLITARGGIDCNGDLDVDGHTNLDNVSIAGVTTFSDDVKFTGTNYNVEWDKSTGRFQFDADAQLRFQGSSFRIYNDGSGTSFIRNTSTNLRITSDIFRVRKANDSTHYINCQSNNVKLFYAGSNRLETTEKGIQVGTGVTIETNGNSNFVGVSSLGTGDTGAVYLYNPDADALSATTNDAYGWKAKTYASGLQVNSTLYLSRSGSNGLSLAYNNATGSFITANSGFLRLGVPYGGYLNLYSNDVYIKDRLETKTFAHFEKVSGTSYKTHLYGGDSVVKLTTEESGVNIVGTTTTTQLAVTGVSTFTGNVFIGTTDPTTVGTVNKNLVVGSVTNNDEVGLTLNVMEGVNGRRVKFFLDDDDGVFGVDSTASTGVAPFVVRITGTERFRINTSGISTFSSDVAVYGSKFKLPVGTSNPSSPIVGDSYYNTAAGSFKIYDGSTWGSVLFAAAGSQQNPATSASNLGATGAIATYYFNPDAGTAFQHQAAGGVANFGTIPSGGPSWVYSHNSCILIDKLQIGTARQYAMNQTNFLKFIAESITRTGNTPYIYWAVFDTGTLWGIWRIRWTGATYSSWVSNHDYNAGGGGTPPSGTPSSDVWKTGSGTTGNAVATGTYTVSNDTNLDRAVLPFQAYQGGGAYGIHYKRYSDGEHYPWRDSSGNCTSNGYFRPSTSYSMGTDTRYSHYIYISDS